MIYSSGVRYLNQPNMGIIINMPVLIDKITVDMLKTILQSDGTGDVLNRRESTMDYDNYVFYSDG